MGAFWEVSSPRGLILNKDGGIDFSALEPREPFDKLRGKRRIAAMVLPMLIMSTFLNPSMVFRMSTFSFGAAFFGQPLISRGMTWLHRNYPHWQEIFEIKKYPLECLPSDH